MWYILLWVTLFFSGGDTMQLRGTSGRLELYESSEEVSKTWNITVPEGNQVKIYGISWSLNPSQSCDKNYLQMTSWGDVTYSLRFCPMVKFSRDRKYHFQSNKVTVTFTSEPLSPRKPFFQAFFAAEEIVCETPPGIDSGIFTFTTEKNETKYNATIRYECRQPYYYMSGSNGTYRCGADGAWEDVLTLSRDPPVCLPDCALKKDLAHSRIYGGKYAQLGQFPWQAYIKLKSTIGAGALLYDKWIITAANVLQSEDLSDLSTLAIRLGTLSWHDDDYIKGYVEKLFIHENYDKDYNNDIALIKLKNKITIGYNVQGICLPTEEPHFKISHNESDHHVGVVAGWGVTEALRPSRKLRFVEVDIVEQKTCKDTYVRKLGRQSVISDNMMCAGHPEGGRDTCNGDGGGALAFLDDKTNKWFIGGISSWGLKCGVKGQPGVYTKVSNYLNWIKNIVQNN